MALTKKDIEQLEKKFATKDDLVNTKQEILDVMQGMVTDLKSYFFELVDPVLREVQASREEREILSHRVSNHEDRLIKLETNASN